MEETTLDETESVPKKDPKVRRSSILKHRARTPRTPRSPQPPQSPESPRTPLKVIGPKRVIFSVKQTKEFHSTEAPLVLGSSYEESFHSDPPKSTQESHFTMKMVHSAATESYSERVREANRLFWQEELLNTTHFVSVDNFESSESECEARMSIDIQQTETQHYSLGIEDIAQRSLNWNEQVENVENLPPELLQHFMKKQKASQIFSQSGNTVIDHEIEKSVNISDHNTSKANVWQHNSSQTFIEYSFPSRHIVRSEDMCSNELMPYVLNRSDSTNFPRGASIESANKPTKMTQLEKHTVHINNELLMDADMELTDVIHIKKPNSGSDACHGSSGMDITKDIFCRVISSNNDGAQGYGDLDESEIELTNTVGHIAASESESTFSKISGIKMLECDGSSIGDSSNVEKAPTKYMHKINAQQLRPSNTMQSTTHLASAVDGYKIHTVAPATLEEKNCILEKSDAFQMHLCEKKKDVNDTALKFPHDCHTEFIDAISSRAMEDIATTKVNENNSKSSTQISNASCTELTNASCQKLATEVSQVSQMESINVKGHKSAAKISDNNQLELMVVVGCNSPSKDIDDNQLELTNVTVCKPVLPADISSSIQINNDSANDSQLEFTDTIHCKSIATVSDNYMEFTDAAGFKMPVKVTDNSNQEPTEDSDYGVDMYKINLEYTSTDSGKLNSNEQVECGSAHLHKTLTEVTNLNSVTELSDHRQEQSSSGVSCTPLADAISGVSIEFTNVNCMPGVESCNDSQLEFASVVAYKPAKVASTSYIKETHCHVNEHTKQSQLESTGPKSSDSSMEFTNTVKQKSSVEDSKNSQLEFTNITGQNQLTKDSESSQQKINIVQNVHAKDADVSQLEVTDINGQNLEFTNSTIQKLPTKTSDGSQLEFTNNVEQKLVAEDSDDSQLEISDIRQKPATKHSDSSQLEFTNNRSQKLDVEDSDSSLLEFTNIICHKRTAKDTNVSQLGIADINQKLATNHSDSQLEFTNCTMQKPFTKDVDDSQMEFTNNTRQKLSAKDPDDSQIVFANSAMPKTLARDLGDSQLEFTESVEHNILAAKHRDVSQLDFTNTSGQKVFTKDTDTDLISLKDTDVSQLEFTNIAGQKLPTKDPDNSQIVFVNNTIPKTLAKDSGQLEFTVSFEHNILAAKHTDVSQLEFTNIVGQKLLTKDTDVSQLDITNTTMQKLPTKACDGNQLELTNNIGQKLPAEDSDNTQLESIDIVSPKVAAKDTSVGQLEITDISQKPGAKNSDSSQLQFTNCTMQKLFSEDCNGSQLEFTNNTRQKVPAEDSDNSQVAFANSTMQKRLAKDSVDSFLEFTDSVKHNKLTAKHRDVSQMEFTNIAGQKLLTKDIDDSQLDISNIAGHKLPTFDGSQLKFTNNIGQKLVAEDSDNSLLEFTNIICLKQAAKDTDDSQLEITDINQKLATKHFDSSQLEFTNCTMQKPFTKDFDSQLEFTNITRQKLSVKDSDNSEVIFTNNAMQKPLTKDSVGSRPEFTSISGQMLLTKDVDISELDITNNTMNKQHTEDPNDAHVKAINNTKQRLPVKDSVDSQLEFTNNTSDKPFAKDLVSLLEVSNLITKGCTAKDSNDSQLKIIDNTRQMLYKNDSHDKTRQQLLSKDFDDSQLQLTNIAGNRLTEKYAGHNTPTKDYNGSLLEFTGTAGCIPSVKHSTDVELEAIHLEHTLDCLKIPNELILETAALKENKIEGNCDQIDSQVLSLNDIRLESDLGFCYESGINRTETVDRTNSPNGDDVLNVADVSKKMLSHKKTDISNESVNPYKSQLELTNIAPLTPTTNISTNLSCSKTAGETDQFGPKTTGSSLLELTNVVGIKPMAESCKSKTTIVDPESAKVVEKDKCIESTVIMDITNDINCRKNPKSLMELTNIGSHPEYSVKCSYAERKENVNMSIDTTELGSNLSASRKRHVNDLSCEHSNDCELECSSMKYFKSVESADAQLMIGASEIASSKSSNERYLEFSATTELEKASPQHTDGIILHHANCNQIDMTNTVTCGTIKNSLRCISPVFGIPSINLDKSRHSDTVEYTSKQSYVSQLLDNLEFTACIKDANHVSKDNLAKKQAQLSSHLKACETGNSGQEISPDLNVPQSITTVNPHQDDLTHAIAVADSDFSPTKKEVGNDAYRATYLPTSNTKQKRAQKKMQKAQKLLSVTIGSDETFMFDTCTSNFVAIPKLRMSKQFTIASDEIFVFDTCSNTYVPAAKPQVNKQLEHFDTIYSNASSPERIQQDTNSENATYKTKEKVKENQKQNIELMQTKDINMHYKPEDSLLLEDELITLNDESMYNFEREDEACDNLMKVIQEADKSLFSSFSTSPGTALSSNSGTPTAANANEYLEEEIYSNLEKNKSPSNEAEVMTEVEGNFANGQLQPSDMSETKMEMCNVSIDTDALSTADKDASSVEQTEVLTFFSHNRGETREITDIETSGEEKETVHLSNFTLAHMELNCIESILHNKTEQFKADVALDMSQSCVAVIQKPLSLEEWLRSGKHEWDVKELSDTQWSFLFLYKSLGLVLKLDAANVKDGVKYISDILLESYLAMNSAPETHFVHHILLKKLSPQNLKAKFKVTADVPELLGIISSTVAEMKLFLKDFFFMETCKLMEMKGSSVSFKMSDLHIPSVFRVSVDLSSWENIKPEDVTVEELMGTINKNEVQNLVNAVPKGPTFLSEYVDIIREYISIFRKK